MDEPSRPVVRLRRREPAALQASSTPEPPAETPATPHHGRRRRVALAISAAVLLVCGVVAAIASTGEDGGDDNLLVLETPSTQRIPRSTTTTTIRSVPVPLVPVPPAPVAPGRPAPLAPRPSTTTTAGGDGGGTATPPPDCRDSTDPVCGPWFWEPEPGPNQPLVIQVVYFGLPGLPTEVGANISDADAAIVCWRMVTNTGAVLYDTPCSPPSCPTRYGPWTPPATAAGFQNLPRTSLQGGYAVSVHAESAGYGCSPYGSVQDV